MKNLRFTHLTQELPPNSVSFVEIEIRMWMVMAEVSIDVNRSVRLVREQVVGRG